MIFNVKNGRESWIGSQWQILEQGIRNYKEPGRLIPDNGFWIQMRSMAGWMAGHQAVLYVQESVCPHKNSELFCFDDISWCGKINPNVR
jgi:hypothetical protein